MPVLAPDQPLPPSTAIARSESLDRTGLLTVVGVFVALVVDGMGLQMLALALPSISSEPQLSSVAAGALSTYTPIGMGIGGVLAGWLSDRVGRVRVVWWAVLVFSALTGVIAVCRTLRSSRPTRCSTTAGR